MVNIYEILQRAASLKEETVLNSISPERAGGIMYDTLLALNDLWLQQGSALVISKIYESVAAMEADTAPVSDLTGKPLRPGQIVVIASSDSDNGSVYRYNGTDAPSWSLVGAIGNLTPVDSLDSDSTTLPLAANQGKVLDGKISQLGQKIKGIEQSEVISDIDEIIFVDNDNNEVLHISSGGVNAKNLKSNGKNCVAIEQIQENSTQEQTQEIEFRDNNNNIVATIKDEGIFDKNGNEILGQYLNGKKAIFFGDSIIEGIATADWQKQWFGGWPRLLRDRDRMTISNKGIGGTTLRDNAQSSNGICQRLIADTTLNQYDYIILSGGFNDFANWTADDGVITNGYNSAFDTTKSMGALENCINYLQKNFPDKHIGFILCYDIGAIYEPYYEAIVEVLEKWSMPYIDLRKESAFNLNNHDQANVYGVYEGSVAWFDSTQNYVTDDKCQYNGVVYSAKHNIVAGGSFNEEDWNLAPEGTHTFAPWHINVIGYRKSYSQIKNWMKTL